MSTPLPAQAQGAIKTPAEADIARGIALLSEGLLTRTEFEALTGMDPQQLPQYLGDPAHLSTVQRTALQLRNSGALARLEALRRSRDAVNIAAEIMLNSETHASNRLMAAAFIAKVSGVQRPVDGLEGAGERFTVTINIGGNHPPIVIDKPASSREPLDNDIEPI